MTRAALARPAWLRPALLLGLLLGSLAAAPGHAQKPRPAEGDASHEAPAGEVAEEVIVEGGAQVVRPSGDAPVQPMPADPRTPGARTVIPREAFQDTQKTVADVLEEVPGLTVTRSGDALSGTRVSIRGSRADQVLVLLDGVPVSAAADRPTERRAQGRAGLDLAAIPLERVESIEIVRGAASSLYGPGAAAGAILIRTHRATQPALAVAGTVGSDGYREGDLAWSLPLHEAGGRPESLTLHVNSRRSAGTYVFFDPDAALAGSAPDNPCAVPLGDGLFERRCNATRTTTLEADWRQGPRRHVSALLERLERDGLGGIEDPRPYGHEERRRLRLLYEDAHAPADDGPTDGADGALLAWRASAERLTSERDENTLAPEAELVGGFTDERAAGELRWEQWLRRHRLDVGAALEREVLDDRRFTAARTTPAAFAAWRFHGDEGTWEASLRRDDPSDLAGETTWRAALGQGLWRVGGARIGLKASHGTGYRPPTLYERYDPGALPGESVANPTLQPERSVSTDAGPTLAWGEAFYAEVLAFRQEAEQQIVALPAPASPNQFRFENVTRTRTTGYEAAVSLRPGAGIAADLAWTRQEAVILDNDAVDPRHNGNRVPGVPDELWNLALAWRHAGWHLWGQARHSGTRWVDPANTRFLRPYTVYDAGLTAPLNPAWSVSLEGRNVTGVTYAELDNYPPPGAQVLVTLRWERPPLASMQDP